MERWRQPVRLVSIESSTDTMTIGGRRYRDYEYVIGPADWERIRLGYVCVQCFEPHESPFPAACQVCGTTASQQRDRIGVEYAGVIAEGETYEDEEARMQDDNERRKHRPGSSIVLPRGVTLD